MTTTQLLPLIVIENPDIMKFTFQYYPSARLIQDEISDMNSYERDMFDFAISMRNKYHLPFWDGIMMSSFEIPNPSTRIIKLALRHNPISRTIFVPINELSKIDSIRHENLALCSTIINSQNQQFHLPMIDFHIPISPSNTNVVESVCRILELGKGWIIESGESYHFIGSHLSKWEELQEKLYKAIIFSPIIDTAWISHQLQEKTCSLRVGEKKGVLPIVCRFIG